MSSPVISPATSSSLRAQLEALTASVRDAARPQGCLEDFACQRMAFAQWHFERAAILATQFPEASSESLKYQKVALSWDGSFNRALRQLRDLQTLRAQTGPNSDAPLAKRPLSRQNTNREPAAPNPQPQQNQQTAKRNPPQPQAGLGRPSLGEVGRNSPCPCGSGNKFKRCCGIGAPPLLHHAA